MVCCVIGHRDVYKTDDLKKYVELVFKNLIQNGTDEFLIGSRGAFNDMALSCLRNLKTIYPNKFRIVYVRAEYEYIDDDYKKYLLAKYDDTFMPDCVKNAKKAVYIKRNQYMIDNSDVCVLYCNIEKSGESGTLLSYIYAVKKNKTVINIYDSIKKALVECF